MNTQYPWHRRSHFDDAIIRDVYERNEYDVPPDMTGKCVLDLGGNVGAFARLVAERGAYVTSFDPCAENCRLIEENTRHRSWLVHAVCKAVSDYPGEAEFWVPADPAGGTLYPSGCPGGRSRGTVPVVGIADAVWEATFHANSRHVDLLKMDIEGAEYAIIENCDLADVKECIIEFHNNYVPRAIERSEACRERLKLLGFRELRWEPAHVEHGWYRLYRGIREDL